jgi:hypothetical protein
VKIGSHQFAFFKRFNTQTSFGLTFFGFLPSLKELLTGSELTWTQHEIPRWKTVGKETQSA